MLSFTSNKIGRKKNTNQQQIAAVSEPIKVEESQAKQNVAPISKPEISSVSPVSVNEIAGNEITVSANDLPANSSTQRRLTKSLLSDLDEVLNSTANDALPEKKTITQEEIELVFERYKTVLQQQNKGFVHAQFLMVKPELVGHDEVKMIASAPFAEETIKEQRNLLIEFYTKHFDQHIRITTELRIDPNSSLNNLPKTLSRQEIFEQMAMKNPELLQLKEALNLQLDF